MSMSSLLMAHPWRVWALSGTWGGRKLAMTLTGGGVHANLRRARCKWHKLSHLLHGEGAHPWIFGMFHKAVVQTVLLFGCESWTVTDAVPTVLKGFHHWAARRMADMMACRGPGCGWIHPSLEEALEKAGLHAMELNIVCPNGNNAQWTTSPQDLSGCIAWWRGGSLGPLPRLFVGGIRREGRRSLLTRTGRMELLVCEDIGSPSPPPCLVLGQGPKPCNHFGGEDGSSPGNAPSSPSF